jgi:hypothetical protein
VRPLRPVRRPPAGGSRAGRVLGRLQEYIRTGTLTTGTATAFGGALAPCDGSDLLPLRLRSTCSWVIPVCGTAPILEGWRVVAIPRRSTPRSFLCAPSRLRQPGLLESFSSLAPFRVFGFAARTGASPPRDRPLRLAARPEYSQTQVPPLWVRRSHSAVGHSLGFVVFPEPATLGYG